MNIGTERGLAPERPSLGEELELSVGDSWDGPVQVYWSNERQEEACVSLHLGGSRGIGKGVLD